MTDHCCSRRTLLKGAALGAAVAVPVLASCSDGSGVPGQSPEAGERLASLDDFEDGQTLVVMTAKGVPVVLTRQGGEVVAHSGVCPHQGCAVRVEVDNLLCPCHNSKFEFDGTLISGPADTDLDPTVVHLDGRDIITGP
nr:Rieske (2Fe-2S) protein [Actinomycetales bacterium]